MAIFSAIEVHLVTLGLPTNVPWKRFWVPHEARPELWDGYLVDPDHKPYGVARNADAKTLAELDEFPCLVLLGEPGIGKSSVVEAYVKERRASEGAAGFLFVDFRWEHRNLEEAVFRREEIQPWAQSRSPFTLVLDSLDEYGHGAAEAARQLIQKLKETGTQALRLRVACRTAEWPATLAQELPRLFEAQDAIACRALAPLRRIDVELAAGNDAEAFLAEVERVNAAPLASKPVTLDFLLRQYRQEERALPRFQVELYKSGCLSLCEDPSASRVDVGRTGTLPADARLAIASRVAAVTVLGRRSQILFRRNRSAPSMDAITIQELVGGTEPAAQGEIAVTEEALREVLLHTGLFRPGGDGCVVWAHQTYAEFLAAYFLSNRKLAGEEQWEELSDKEVGVIVPALRETAAWAANMDPKMRRHLLSNAPEVLLSSDFAMMGEHQIADLASSLLTKIDKQELRAQVILWNQGGLLRLKHDTLAQQLRPYLVGRHHDEKARLTAIRMAKACKIRELQKELIDLALDGTETEPIRAYAAEAIAKMGDRPWKCRLKELLLREDAAELSDELRGSVLEALWPEDLTAAELFSHLLAPKDESHGDSYHSFVYNLKSEMSPAFLREALAWARGRRSRYLSPQTSWLFAGLRDAIFANAWKSIHVSSLVGPFAEAVRACLSRYDRIFNQPMRDDADPPDFARNDPGRRALARALVALPPWREHEHEAYDLVDKGIVLPVDVPWVLQQFDESNNPAIKQMWVKVLLEFVRNGRWTFEVADPILGAIEASASFRAAMPAYLSHCVELGSPLSRAMRRSERWGRKQQAKRKYREKISKRVHPRPKPKRHLRVCLRRFAQGDLAACWELLRGLEVDPQNRHHADYHEWNIHKLPGWEQADGETRQRIVEVGKACLLKAHESTEEWLDKNIYYHPVFAGYRYLCLLLQADPQWLEANATTLWQRWAGVLLVFPLHNGHEINQALVARAYRANAPHVRRVLQGVLEEEHERRDEPDVLGRMRHCWDERLIQFVLDFAKRPHLKPAFWGWLLDDLLARKAEDAVAYAIEVLAGPLPEDGPERSRKQIAACVLMARLPDRAWPLLYPHFNQSRELGRDVLYALAKRIRYPAAHTWCKGLDISSLEQIFVWIEQNLGSELGPYRAPRGIISDEQIIRELQQGIIPELVGRGNREAIAALDHLRQLFPDRDWTWDRLVAKEVLAQATWTPRTPAQVIALRPILQPTLENKPMPPNAFPFPNPLVDAYKNKRLAVLFGSGLSLAKDVQGGLPTWSALPERLLQHIAKESIWPAPKIDTKRAFFVAGRMPLEEMLSELDTLKTALGRRYRDALTHIFRPTNLKPGDVHRALVELGVNNLVTTNYDALLEHAEPSRARTPYTWKDADKAVADIEQGRPVLLKIHGTAELDDTMVMTQSEYSRVSTDHAYPRIMSHLLKTHTFLFLGYGMNDPSDLDLVLKLNADVFKSSSHTHYVLMKKPVDATHSDRWQREFHIQTIEYDNHEDLPAILRLLRANAP